MDTSKEIEESERALKWLLYAMSLTIVALLIYAAAAPTRPGFVSTIGIGLLVAAAAMVV